MGLLIRRRRFFVLLLIFMFVGVILMFSLRGQLPKTYLVLEAQSDTFVVPYEISLADEFKIDFWAEDELNKWQSGGTAHSELTIDNGCLFVNASFTKEGVKEHVYVSRDLNLNVSGYPLLKMRILVSKDILYHIRFRGVDNNGNVYNVFWETSPLDDRKGKNAWENVTVNLKDFVYIATGREDINITRIIIIMEDYPFDVISSILIISEISFQALTSMKSVWEPNEKAYAIVLNIQEPELIGNYTLTHIRVYYTISGFKGGNYTVYAIIWNETTPIIGKGFTYLLEGRPCYEVAAIYPQNFRVFGYLTELANITLTETKNLSVIFLTDSYFDFFNVEKVILTYEKNRTYPALIPIDPNIAITATTYYIVLTFIAPPLIVACIYVKSYGRNISHRDLLIFLIIGVSLRLLIAPFTGHTFDMEFWKAAAREYYESGTIHLELWPTMPLYLYLLLFSYSFYALLRILGFQDYYFLAHSTGMIEAIFIKMPFILADVASFYFIVKIFGKRNEGKHVFYGSLYLFNPLIIFISSAWGMYDTLALSFLLGGLYFLFVKRRFQAATTLFVLSGLTKPFGFAGYALLIASAIFKKKYNQLVKALTIGTCATLLAFMPFILFGGIHEFFTHFVTRITYTSRSLTSWVGLAHFRPSLPLYPWSYLAIIILIVLWYAYTAKRRETIILNISAAMVLLILSHYLNYHVIYTQHLSWVVPFLIILAYLKRKVELVPYTLLYSLASIIYFTSASTIGYIPVGRPYYGLPLLDVAAAAYSLMAIIILGPYYIFFSSKTGRSSARIFVSEIAKMTIIYAVCYTLLLSLFSYIIALHIVLLCYVVSFVIVYIVIRGLNKKTII
ncbi:MAG: hypothetical protein QXF49_01010 [Thermosphaera sp.]